MQLKWSCNLPVSKQPVEQAESSASAKHTSILHLSCWL